MGLAFLLLACLLGFIKLFLHQVILEVLDSFESLAVGLFLFGQRRLILVTVLFWRMLFQLESEFFQFLRKVLSADDALQDRLKFIEGFLYFLVFLTGWICYKILQVSVCVDIFVLNLVMVLFLAVKKLFVGFLLTGWVWFWLFGRS